MSFSDLIISTVNKAVDSFIEQVADKYNISGQELRSLWNGNQTKTQAKPKKAPEPEKVTEAAPSLTNNSELSGLKKPELVALCKARNLSSTGTKDEMIARLTGGAAPAKKKSPAKPTKEAKESKSEPKPVVKSVQTKIEPFKVSKNSFGNHEHAQTGLVLDKDTKKIIGTQNPKGHIDPLTDEGIEICNKYKLQYVLPENLNAKKATVVEGLPDEDEEDVGEEIEDIVDEEQANEDEDFTEEEFEEEELLEEADE